MTVLRSDGGLGGQTGATDAVHVADPDTTEDVQRLALAAVRALGVTGPACVDVRRALDGAPVVLAVHAHMCRHVEAAPGIVDALLAEHRMPGPRSPGT